MQLTDEQRQMVEDNLPLAYFAVEKYYPKFDWLDPEEVLSACFLGLIYAARKYNPSRGKFSTYAMKSMFRNIRRELIPEKKQVDAMSLEDILTDKGEVLNWQDLFSDGESVEDEAVYGVLSEQLVSVLDKTVASKVYKDIIKCRCTNPEITTAEILRKVGCSQGSIGFALKEARKQLKPLLAI